MKINDMILYRIVVSNTGVTEDCGKYEIPRTFFQYVFCRT